MLVRLILLAFLAAGGVAVFLVLRRRAALQLSPAWSAAAVDCPPLARALTLRQRLVGLLARRRGGFGATLQGDVDALIASMVDLAGARRELLEHPQLSPGGRRAASLEDVDARLADAEAQVRAAVAHVAELTGGPDPGLDAARDRLTTQTQRLEQSLRAYEEVRQATEDEPG